jgi:hypothetical protein
MCAAQLIDARPFQCVWPDPLLPDALLSLFPCLPPSPTRDLLLLDIALEGWLRLLVERADKRALATPDLVVLLGLVLDSAALTVREGGGGG